MTQEAARRSGEAESRTWRSAALGAGTVVLCLLLGPASAGVAPDYRAAARDRMLDDALIFFGQVALTRPNADGVATAAAVRRWRGPVTVSVSGIEVPGFTALLEQKLGRLADWTGLPFVLGADQTAGDRLTIVIRPHRGHIARFGPGGNACLTTTEGQGGRLHRATIEISDRYLDCLDHELMHALGFDNHWTVAAPGNPCRRFCHPGARATGGLPSPTGTSWRSARSIEASCPLAWRAAPLWSARGRSWQS